jgi:hypothetical protein
MVSSPRSNTQEATWEDPLKNLESPHLFENSEARNVFGSEPQSGAWIQNPSQSMSSFLRGTQCCFVPDDCGLNRARTLALD